MKETEIGLSVKVGIREKVVTTPEINKKFLPGEIGAVLDWEIRDSKTGLLVPGGKGIKKSESFTRQFLDLLWLKFNNSMFYNYWPVLDTSNVLQDCLVNSANVFATNALAGDALFGIIAGTGNTAPTITDYAIETLIAHGAGAGQLQYSIVTWGADAADATTSQFTITRNFANASGGSITVNEVALYVKTMMQKPLLHLQQAMQIRYFMTIRDVIAGGIAVANGQTLTVNYRPQCVI